jgi:beta-lactamase superfamily II metal-dependent hydrolase
MEKDMTEPAREKWWDDVVRKDSVKLNDYTTLLWGDRVRVIERNANRAKVAGRGSVGWIDEDCLGGEELLEVYFVDVGQGDGILVVTPEGHHLMIDGGYRRSKQQARKSAADFVDWKFHKDYLSPEDHGDANKDVIRLDAMISSHADWDHYGGLRDLVDSDIEAEADELDCLKTTVEAFYHPGLCPQYTGTEKLGPKSDGVFTTLLGDRASAEDGIKTTPAGDLKIRGEYRDFIKAVVKLKTKQGDKTPITRLSHKSGSLPGFFEADNTAVKIQVLAPIEIEHDGEPALEDLGDEGVNKNGHSVALRLDYGDRRILLTGDLNDACQKKIMEHYADAFPSTWRSDVTKACHHGSHHVDLGFLKGVNALSTVFSSGDANTYDHPRAWVLGAAALSGRVIEDPHKPRLKAPLIYSTEIARSIGLKGVDQLRMYAEKQEYKFPDVDPEQTVSGEQTMKKWRVVLDHESSAASDMPPADRTRVMSKMIYGLVNVRTDGHRLLFAVRNEGNHSWALETMETDEIETAYVVARKDD